MDESIFDVTTLFPPNWQDNDECHEYITPYLDFTAGRYFCPYPECDTDPKCVGDIVPHLNDVHRYNFEAIAKYLEQNGDVEIEGYDDPRPTY